MSYLSVANFWKYQNADVWKKSKTHPPWFKHYVHHDRELDRLPVPARLLFWELVAAATRYSNVLEADLKWLYAETRVEPELIREMLPMLLKGGWLSETRTPRRSRKLSRGNREDPRDQDVEEEEETPSTTRKVSSSSDRSEETGDAAQATPNGAAPLNDAKMQNLGTFASKFWDDYPDKTILHTELMDRGLTDRQATAILQTVEATRQAT